MAETWWTFPGTTHCTIPDSIHCHLESTEGHYKIIEGWVLQTMMLNCKGLQKLSQLQYVPCPVFRFANYTVQNFCCTNFIVSRFICENSMKLNENFVHGWKRTFAVKPYFDWAMEEQHCVVQFPPISFLYFVFHHLSRMVFCQYTWQTKQN